MCVKRLVLMCLCLVTAYCEDNSRNKLHQVEMKLDALWKHYTVQEETLKKHERLNERLEMTVQNQEKSIRKLETMLSDTREGDIFIGFTVYQSEPRNYSTGEKVQFHGVISNDGSHFNLTNSQFECPVSGYYLFFATVMNSNGYGAEMDIMVEDTRIAVAYARDSAIFHQAANMGVIYCDVGQQVWAKNRQEGDHIHGFMDFSYTSFSGVLIRRAANMKLD